jgi:CubicO group peptidase (beta-lactamase class C family)
MFDHQATLARMAEGYGIPGLCVAIYANGHMQSSCLGEDAAGSGRAINAESWFQAASTGKHVTAAVILDLERAGLIALDDPLGRHCPDAPTPWQDRSIRSLLNHTSGLPEYLAYIEGEEAPTHRADFMARYAHLAPMAAEGAAWGYSNTNYILLGFIIAAVTGDSYASAVHKLFAAAGVNGATVASPDWVRRANANPDIAAQDDKQSADREVIGDGDIAFTSQGACDWLRYLLEKADTRMFDAPLLATKRRSLYGCGWFVETMGDDDIAHHAGHYDGWTAMAFLNRSRKTGAIALCNLAPGNTRAIRAVAQAALEATAPGSTPLGLAQVHDAETALTNLIRAQLIRRGAPADRDCFAPELQTAIDKGGSVRGVLDLWSGEDPAAFTLVEEQHHGASRMRRYRIVYRDRTEHVLVGLTHESKIYWIWPL